MSYTPKRKSKERKRKKVKEREKKERNVRKKHMNVESRWITLFETENLPLKINETEVKRTINLRDLLINGVLSEIWYVAERMSSRKGS